MRNAPFRHNRSSTTHNPTYALCCHGHAPQENPSMDRKIVYALFSLLDQGVTEKLKLNPLVDLPTFCEDGHGTTGSRIFHSRVS